MGLSEKLQGKRLFNLGYPRFDLLESEHTMPEQMTALWLPRWTTSVEIGDGNIGSGFFDYKDKLLDYAAEHEDFRLIVRPHPLAFDNYIKFKMMTEDDVQEYKQRLTASTNTSLDENSSYLDSFKEASVLIADYTSIIFEYFLQNRPIIYCGKQDELSDALKYISDTFYYAESWEDIQKTLDDLKHGIDPKQAIRNAAVEKLQQSSSDAGQKIVNQLLSDAGR